MTEEVIKNIESVNLITFKIGDLMRARCKSN